MSALSIRKGKNFERELAAYLRSHGVTAERGIGQARRSSEVPDVDVEGWWIEAKRHQRTNPKAALQQAIGDANENGEGRVPVAVCRDNGTAMQDTTVTMRLDDWIELVRDRRDLLSVCHTAASAEKLSDEE